MSGVNSQARLPAARAARLGQASIASIERGWLHFDPRPGIEGEAAEDMHTPMLLGEALVAQLAELLAKRERATRTATFSAPTDGSTASSSIHRLRHAQSRTAFASAVFIHGAVNLSLAATRTTDDQPRGAAVAVSRSAMHKYFARR